MKYVLSSLAPRQNPMKTRIVISQDSNFFTNGVNTVIKDHKRQNAIQYMSVLKGVCAHTHTPRFFHVSGNKNACKAQLIETSKVWTDLQGLQHWNNTLKEWILGDPEKM